MAKGAEQKGFKKKIFNWAVELGLRYEHDRKNGWWYHLQLSVADKLVFSKWREALGSSVKIIVSGGAALQPRLAKIFTAAGVPVVEGYGLSETSPVIAVNRPEPYGACFTTVGPVIKNVEIKFAADGEICVRGDNNMMGYYKQPEKTLEVIDADGFFHTGDIGELIDHKFLKITDRKKELFKTSGGKYVSPAALENKLKESVYIEQAMVVGDAEKFVGALIIPNYAELKAFCKSKNIAFTSDEDLTNSKEVQKLYRGIIDEMNVNFNHVEQIKKFRLLHTEWSINGGELTPKLSMKRKIIMERCKESIESMYRKNSTN
jgi:long-chain acyl-CoA synthetase